jgi:polyhydroxyalkanoate synthesis regulator phasin
MNEVTLFSNGIGHFRRSYTVSGETPIRIPFNKKHVGDVAASLQVFGPVKLVTPPSFTASNADDTALSIDGDNAMRSLLTKLAGSKVKLTDWEPNKDRVFTLVGLHSHAEYSAAGRIRVDEAILECDGSLFHRQLNNIGSLLFVEDTVKAEIVKALRANFEKIKPDSTFLELVVVPVGEGGDALVQYTIPVAAWKMRYAIRQDNGGTKFEGAAIIDNNTEEDWDNFRISVVTGNPISFDTDIAQIVVPERRFVHLVDQQALGNVSAEEGVCMAAAAGGAPRAKSLARGLRPSNAISPAVRTAEAYSLCMSNRADFGLESAVPCGAPEMVAEAPEVEAKEVGDFCVFSSKEPTTILARKSAVVPMFCVDLPSAGLVLLYKQANHPRRPFRAIKFKNETEFSLGKGKTSVYNQGVFSGECVLEAAKPGDNRLLAHCLENGVKIVAESGNYEQTHKAISVSAGLLVFEDTTTITTTYTIENKKDEPFKLLVEHVNALGMQDVEVTFDGVEIAEKEKLSNGYRLYFNLDAGASLKLTATEAKTDKQTIVLSSNFAGYYNIIVERNKKLADDAGLKACMVVQDQINDVNEAIRQLQTRTQELTTQCERTRANLESVKNVVGQNKKVEAWVEDLDNAEKELRDIEKKQSPEQRKKLRELNKSLEAKVKEIALNWTA